VIERCPLFALAQLSERLAYHVLPKLWSRYLAAAGVDVGDDVRAVGRPIVSLTERSTIAIGDRVVLVSVSHATALGVSRPTILRTLRPEARIEVGADSGLSGTAICAARNVRIGSRVLLGADVLIADTDFHAVDAVPRRHLPVPDSRPEDSVLIEDDVFIGAGSTVLKGVTIGCGSVIGAASVVVDDIPPFVVAAGNPCRPLRRLQGASPRLP
jgi:acetyltransferase-like isoleucine patch superfamily enzyme